MASSGIITNPMQTVRGSWSSRRQPMQAQRERVNSNENQITFHFETFYSVMKTYVLCFAFSVFVILMNN